MRASVKGTEYAVVPPVVMIALRISTMAGTSDGNAGLVDMWCPRGIASTTMIAFSERRLKIAGKCEEYSKQKTGKFKIHSQIVVACRGLAYFSTLDS